MGKVSPTSLLLSVGVVFLAIVLSGMVVLSTASEAAEFSADVVTVDVAGRLAGKAYVQQDRVRHEFEAEGGRMIAIFRPDMRLMWALFPVGKCVEVTISAGPDQPMNDAYKKVELGSHVVNGHVCDGVLYEYRNRALGTLTQWVSQSLGYPVRVEVRDAAGKVTSTTDYSNIEEEGLTAELFEVPPGTRR